MTEIIHLYGRAQTHDYNPSRPCASCLHNRSTSRRIARCAMTQEYPDNERAYGSLCGPEGFEWYSQTGPKLGWAERACDWVYDCFVAAWRGR